MQRGELYNVGIPKQMGVVKAKLRYVTSLTSDVSGIINTSISIGGVISASTDFADFKNCFNRFNIVRSRLLISPVLNSLTTVIKTPLFVNYINDGVVGNPGSQTAVVVLEQAAMVSPYKQDSAATLSVNCKPTLDPWAPTTSPTAAQLLQYGGYQFYASSNVASLLHWYVIVEADVIFADKN
jgi:hypothetical protein